MDQKGDPVKADGHPKPNTLGKAIAVSFGVGLLCGCAGVIYLAQVRGLAVTDEEAGGWSLMTTSVLIAFGIVPVLMRTEETAPSIVAGGVAGVLLGMLYGVLTHAMWNGIVFGTSLGLGTAFVVNRIVPSDTRVLSQAIKRMLPVVAAAFIAAHFTGWLPASPLIPKSEYLQSRHEREQHQNPGGKLAALKAVANHLKQFPDRFAADSERTAFNEELQRLINEFTGTAFSARDNPSIAKAIVELFETKIEGRFSGHLYNILMEHVQGIYAESLDR